MRVCEGVLGHYKKGESQGAGAADVEKGWGITDDFGNTGGGFRL